MDNSVQPSDGEDQSQTPPEEGSREDTFFIASKMLSKYLDPESIKAGDVLEFKVVGKDADGDVEVEYNTGDSGEEDHKSGMDKMKTDLATHMSGPAEEPTQT